jgi:hypothetical protein
METRMSKNENYKINNQSNDEKQGRPQLDGQCSERSCHQYPDKAKQQRYAQRGTGLRK